MKSAQSLIASLNCRDFLTSVDIKNAYLYIPTFPGYQRFSFLCSWWKPLSICAPFLSPESIHKGHFTICGSSSLIINHRIPGQSIAVWNPMGHSWWGPWSDSITSLGLLLETFKAKVILPQKKLIQLQNQLRQLQSGPQSSPSKIDSMLGLIVSNFKESQLYSRTLQHSYGVKQMPVFSVQDDRFNSWTNISLSWWLLLEAL